MRLCVRFASLRSVGLLLVVSLPLAGCAGNATKLLQVGAAPAPVDATLGVTPPNNQSQHSQPQRVASLDIAATNDASPTFPANLTGGGAESQTESSSSAEYPRPTQSKGTQIAYGTDRFVNQSRSVNQAEALPDGDVVLNFSDTDIREVAQSVLGDVLKLNFVVDIESQARITLRTNRPIPKSSVLPTLETTLAASGLALAREGEIYRIVPAAKAKGSGRLTRVRMLRDEDRRACANRPPPGFPLANAEAFLAIEPVDAVLARRLAFTPQQNEQSPVAEPPALVRQSPKMRPQVRIVRTVPLIAHACTVSADHPAGPPFREPQRGAQMRDSFALDAGPYHFFESSSFRAA